uniref:Uncharacterized protein n=1 Tax=Physcomitrium patens TaxID=3218 RepID=A0A2K1KPG5_PHYPA|nr:hypothetical protein PHYPA_006581 [Physcomitrium patens]
MFSGFATQCHDCITNQTFFTGGGSRSGELNLEMIHFLMMVIMDAERMLQC